jgi:hypothetical protein
LEDLQSTAYSQPPYYQDQGLEWIFLFNLGKVSLGDCDHQNIDIITNKDNQKIAGRINQFRGAK